MRLIDCQATNLVDKDLFNINKIKVVLLLIAFFPYLGHVLWAYISLSGVCPSGSIYVLRQMCMTYFFGYDNK